MIARDPLDSPAEDLGEYHDESEPPELLARKPKNATFHWPPGCLWPFVEHEVDGKT